MSERELIAYLEGEEMGRVAQSAQGRLQFTYAQGWLESEHAYPLSLSMPLQKVPHSHARIDTFLWGLLPDNAAILRSAFIRKIFVRRWANRRRTSIRTRADQGRAR